MPWKLWLFFVLTEGALCLSPGPAVLLVLSKGLSRGTRTSLYSTLGIVASNTFYFILSATSLGALFLASPKLFIIVKYIGAAYLVWMGAKALFGKASVFSVRPAGARQRRRQLFMEAFMLQAANPKALFFFTALLPQFLDPQRPLGGQVAVLGVISQVMEFFILWGYGAFAGRISRFLERPAFAKATDRTAGVLLIAAGIGLSRLNR